MAPLASNPDISPDGNRVAFGTFIRGAWSIAAVDVSGSNFTIIGEGYNPRWSPDGKRLAFTRVVGGRAQVFTVLAENGTDLVQVTNGDYDNVGPSWSPDGAYLVFASNRGSRKPPKGFEVSTGLVVGTFNLFALKTDGSGLVQLTDGKAQSIQPNWGKDGWIYFSSNQAGNYDIWRLRPSGELLSPK
jgi:TolB protein